MVEVGDPVEYIVVFEKNEGSKGCLLEQGKTPDATYFPVVTKLMNSPAGAMGEAEKRGVRRGDFLTALNGEAMALGPEVDMELDDVLAKIQTASYPMRMTFTRYPGYDVEEATADDEEPARGASDIMDGYANRAPLGGVAVKTEEGCNEEDNGYIQDPGLRDGLSRSSSLSGWPFAGDSPRLRGFSEDLASPQLDSLSMPPPAAAPSSADATHIKQEQSSGLSPYFRSPATSLSSSSLPPMPPMSLGPSSTDASDPHPPNLRLNHTNSQDPMFRHRSSSMDSNEDSYYGEDYTSNSSPSYHSQGWSSRQLSCSNCQAAYPYLCRTHEQMGTSKTANMYTSCRFCHQDIHRKGLTRHQRYCKNNPNPGMPESNKSLEHLEGRTLTLYENCRYCGLRIYKGDLAAHHASCVMQPTAEPTSDQRERAPWSGYPSSYNNHKPPSFDQYSRTGYGTSSTRGGRPPLNAKRPLPKSGSAGAGLPPFDEFGTSPCQHCGVVFFIKDLNRHEQLCERNPEAQLIWKYGKGNFARCTHCGKGTHVKGAATHEKYCALNPERGMKRRRKEEPERRLYDPKLVGLCRWCGAEKHRKGLVRHEAYCESNPNKPESSSSRNSGSNTTSMTCRYCGRSDLHPRGLGPHERFCPHNPTKPPPRPEGSEGMPGGPFAADMWDPPGAAALGHDRHQDTSFRRMRKDAFDRPGMESTAADLLEDDGQLYSCRFCALPDLGIHELAAHEQLCNQNPARQSTISPLSRLHGINLRKMPKSPHAYGGRPLGSYPSSSSYTSGYNRSTSGESGAESKAGKQPVGRPRSKPKSDSNQTNCQYCGKMVNRRCKDRHETLCSANPIRKEDVETTDPSEQLPGPCRFCGHMIHWAELTKHETHCEHNPMRGLRPPRLHNRPRGPNPAASGHTQSPGGGSGGPVGALGYGSAAGPPQGNGDAAGKNRDSQMVGRPRSGGIGGEGDAGATLPMGFSGDEGDQKALALMICPECNEYVEKNAIESHKEYECMGSGKYSDRPMQETEGGCNSPSAKVQLAEFKKNWDVLLEERGDKMKPGCEDFPSYLKQNQQRISDESNAESWQAPQLHNGMDSTEVLYDPPNFDTEFLKTRSQSTESLLVSSFDSNDSTINQVFLAKEDPVADESTGHPETTLNLDSQVSSEKAQEKLAPKKSIVGHDSVSPRQIANDGDLGKKGTQCTSESKVITEDGNLNTSNGAPPSMQTFSINKNTPKPNATSQNDPVVASGHSGPKPVRKGHNTNVKIEPGLEPENRSTALETTEAKKSDTPSSHPNAVQILHPSTCQDKRNSPRSVNLQNHPQTQEQKSIVKVEEPNSEVKKS